MLGTPEPARREAFRLPGQPEIMRVGNVRNDAGDVVAANVVSHGFHSDMSYRANPAAITMLYAVQVPSRGGDTEYTSLYRLYDELDEETRRAWAALEVEHETRSSYFADDPDRRTVRPLIQRHPDSGRSLVFASPAYTQRVLGLADADSRAILDRVARAIEPPDYAHRWRENDLIVWDNRAVLHRATEYDPTEQRCLWRASIHLRT